MPSWTPSGGSACVTSTCRCAPSASGWRCSGAPARNPRRGASPPSDGAAGRGPLAPGCAGGSALARRRHRRSSAGFASLRGSAGRARDARTADPAIAAGVLREVLLVVLLRVVKLGRLEDLGGDPAVARRRERPLVRVA